MEQLIFEWTPIRIDLRLTQQFPYSRNFFHHLINHEGIIVNDMLVKKSYKLKPRDIVLIKDFSRFLDGWILEEAPAFPLDIRYEADDYLVIYKSKGILSHPNSIRDVGQPSVVGALWHHYKSLPSYGNFIRAGLLHRLDKETDGLMLIAKTEKWLKHFKELFQRKSLAPSISGKEAVPLKKYYRATCHLTERGKIFLESINLPHYIQETVHANIPHSIPKLGITKIMSMTNISWESVTLELEILTGRTHQIRYHLSNHGLPIVGDYLYGSDEEKSLALTAQKLVRQDTNNKEMEYSLDDK